MDRSVKERLIYAAREASRIIAIVMAVLLILSLVMIIPVLLYISWGTWWLVVTVPLAAFIALATMIFLADI